MYDPTPSTLKPAGVAISLVESVTVKHETRIDRIFVKAFLAGVMLSFGGLLVELVQGATALNTANPGLGKLLAGFVFPSGIVMIVLQGHELLTSNMMSYPMAVLTCTVPFWSLVLNWIVVFFGNLCGSLFVAAILVRYSGILSTEPYFSAVQSFATKKAVDPEWHQIFLRGIGCNWLVCTAIWQAAGARDTVSKVYAIWIPIWIFVACSFDHVVANMFYLSLGIMFKAPGRTTASYIHHSLIPTFLGNVIGASFVSLPAWHLYLMDYNVDREAERVESGEVASATNKRSVEGSSIVRDVKG